MASTRDLFASSPVNVAALSDARVRELVNEERREVYEIVDDFRQAGDSDDSASFQRARDALEATVESDGEQRPGYAYVIRTNSKHYSIGTPIDYTSLRQDFSPVVFDLIGAQIQVKTDGGTGFDFIDSRKGKMYGGLFWGDDTLIPDSLVQLGRGDISGNSGRPADTFSFYDTEFRGHSLRAPLIVGASENLNLFGTYCENEHNDANTFAAIFDGANTYPLIESDPGNSAPAFGTGLRNASFNELLSIGGTFYCHYGSAVFASNTDRAKFIQAYAVSFTDSGFVIGAAYNEDDNSGGHRLLWIDGHIEAVSSPHAGQAGLQYDIKFLNQGAYTTLDIPNFRYSNHESQAQAAVLFAPSAMTSVKLRGAQINLGDLSPNNVGSGKCLLLGNPGKFSISGEMTLDDDVAGNKNRWNLNDIAAFVGKLTAKDRTAKTFTGATLVRADVWDTTGKSTVSVG